jgi:hypothetical protein
MSTNNRKILTLNIQNVSECLEENCFFRQYRRETQILTRLGRPKKNRLFLIKVRDFRLDLNEKPLFSFGHQFKRLYPGGMAEWLKAAVLKTVECNSSVGSNPTPSAIFSTRESTT